MAKITKIDRPEPPKVESYYAISYETVGETKIQIVNTEKNAKSYQTIRFPAGTDIRIFVSKLPTIEKNG